MNSLGALQTSMNVTKTRMLQRMGKEGRSYSEGYLNARSTVKETEAAFEDEVSKMKKLLSSLDSYEENLQGFGTLLNDSVIKTKHTTEANRPAWEYLSSVHTTLAGHCRSLRQVFYARMTDLQQFLDADLHATEKARALVRSAKVELDSAEDSLNSLTPNSSNNDILRIYGNYTKATEKFENQYRDSLHMMTDVLAVKDHKIANAWSVLMQELGSLVQQTFSYFDAFEKQMEDLRAYEVSKIEEFDAVRQARQKERTTRHMETLRGLEDDLIQMLMHPDLTLIGAIGVASTGNEKIVQMVVKILDSYGKLVSLLTVAVTREVTTTQDHSTLFRGNSPSTKLMTAFTRILGQGYLDTVLKPFVEAIIEDDPELYEVDPAKTKGDVEENMQHLLKKCQEILDIILNSLDICPPSFRMVTKHLQREVVKRFPDSKNTCIGGFLFLRFLCPVIMAPDALGLIKGPIDKKKKRPLTLICKSLQNLSNNIRFGKKETYMHPVNAFLDDNMDKTNEFFENFVDVPDDIKWDPLTTLEDVRKNEVRQLHGYTKDNIAKIGRNLLGNSPPELVMEIVRLVADLDSAYEYGDEHPELEKYYTPSTSLDNFSRQSRLSQKVATATVESAPTFPSSSTAPRKSYSPAPPERSASVEKVSTKPPIAPPTRQRSFGGMRTPSLSQGAERSQAPPPPAPHPLPPARSVSPIPAPSPPDLVSRSSFPTERPPPPTAAERRPPLPHPASFSASSPSSSPTLPSRPPNSAPPPPVSPRTSMGSASFSGRPAPPSRQPLLARNRPSEESLQYKERSHRASARFAHPPPNHKPLPPTPPPKKSPER